MAEDVVKWMLFYFGAVVPYEEEAMKVFLTGGSGFIGKALLKFLTGTHGDTVVALSRSPAADEAMLEAAGSAAASRGAQASDHCSLVRGDLDSVDAMTAAMAECELVYHAAAWVSLLGSWQQCYHGTVQGTANALRAARAAKVPTFLHISSFTVMFSQDAADMKGATEESPKRVPDWALYARSKAMAEDLVVEAGRDGNGESELRTVTVRPGFVWGPGDTSVIPILRDSIGAGTFRWIKPDDTETVTTFIDNLSYGLRLAALRGRSGEVYNMFDTESPIRVREFFTKYVRAGLPGVKPPSSEVSGKVLWALATVLENIPLVNQVAKRYISRQMLLPLACSLTSYSTKAQTELGYEPPVSFEDGMVKTAEWTNKQLLVTV